MTPAQYNPSSAQDSSGNAPAQQRYIPPNRKVVVTLEFIKVYNLQPAHGGGYGVLGEDGQFYLLDDVIAVLVRNESPLENRLENRLQNRMKK